MSEHKTHRVFQSNVTLVSLLTSSTLLAASSLHLTTRRICTITSANSAKNSTTVTLHKEMAAQSIISHQVWDLYLGKTSRIIHNSIQIKVLEIFQRLQITRDSIPIARIGTDNIKAIMVRAIQTKKESVLSVVVLYLAQETIEVATIEASNMFITRPEEAMPT